ncbi:MAG: hypothetical protein ABI875_09660 [Gemmatimonadales bacterium]
MIGRCKTKAAIRFAPAVIPAAVDQCVPLFLEQLADTFRREYQTPVREHFDQEPLPALSDARRIAAKHGSEMLRAGFSVGQVVHGYGDVCQSVTELAIEQKALISAEEFHTFNRCLDDAIANAVTGFGQAKQTVIDDRAQTLLSRLNEYSEEQRRLVDIAIQAFSVIRTGTIGLTGATGTLLLHTMNELRALAERVPAEIPMR